MNKDCHCCGSDYQLVMIDVYKCVQCAHIYRDYQEDLIKYHQTQYRKGGSATRKENEIGPDGNITQEFHNQRKWIVEGRLKMIEKYLKPNFFCLDIGAGAGTFASEIGDKVNKVDCTELDAGLIAESRRLGFQTYSENYLTLDFDKQYDFISAWHVLEHIEDIRTFVEKTSNNTKKLLCIEVPLLISLKGTGRRRSLTSPNTPKYDGHVHYFTSESFRNLFESHFEILDMKEGTQSPALFAILEKK